MTTLKPRPGPAVIQRANSLQASDTSHTSASTTTDSTSHTSNTSASTSPMKPSPVSSIGESICGDVKSIPAVPTVPPARPVRPLPIPPSPALTTPGLTSTSTLKLSHQESHSTLGKSTLKSSSQSQPPTQRKPRSPPSSYTPHIDDNQWVSISVLPTPTLPTLTERSDTNERLPNSGPCSTHKRSASAGPNPTSTAPKPTFPKHTTRTTEVPTKSLPRLPDQVPPQPVPRATDSSWKLEFRGVVKLVRWASRRDKRADPNAENKNVDDVLDEKEPGMERRGYSIASLGRKSRDQFNQPRPIPGASGAGVPARPRPMSLARPQPKLELEGDKEDEEVKEVGKRRLTKSNPIMFGRNSSEQKRTSVDLKKRPSAEAAKRSSRRTSSDAAQKVLSASRTNTELAPKKSIDQSRRPSVDAGRGMAPNAGGVFVPNISLAVPSTPALSALAPRSEPSAGLLQPPLPENAAALASTYASHPYLRASSAAAPALLTQTTTVTQTTTTTVTTTLAPGNVTSSPFPGHSLLPTISNTSNVLAPVLEGPLYQSPPAIDTTAVNEFPWAGIGGGLGDRTSVGVAVTGGLSPVGSNGISSVASGVSVSPVVSIGVSPVETVSFSPAPPSSESMSPMSSSLSPYVSASVSPMMSTSASPMMSTSASPVMSNSVSLVPTPMMSGSVSPFISASLPISAASTSPLLFNTHLPETVYSQIHVSSSTCVDTPATSSSLSYATARSNRNSISAQVDAVRYGAATDLGHDPRFMVGYGAASEVHFSASNTRYGGASDTQFGDATDLPRFSAAATDLGHGTSTRATSPTPSDRCALSEDVHEYRPSAGILRALSSADHSDAPLPMPRRPFMQGRDSSGSVTFDDSSANSSPRIGGRRKMMTMSASDVGHGMRTPAGHQVQRSTSTMGIAGRIMRKLSIGSKAESETEGRPTRKLTRKKMPSRAGSTASLVYTNGGVPPVPPLPPGIASGRYESEHGHGESVLGHGESVLGHGESVLGHGNGSALGHGSVLGHGQNGSEWGGSTSVLGHGLGTDATSPTPTRLSFATTQSAPSTTSGGRKLLKRRQPGQPRSVTFTAHGRGLASLDLGEGVSREPPRITTEFVQVNLMPEDVPLTGSAGGTTEDGHLMPPRPGLPRRTSSQRRWTIADMDDEEFLRQLEVRLSGAGGRLRQSHILTDFAMGVDQSNPDLVDYRDSDTDNSVAEREWARARRAMMCVREIVRTEKSYLRQLVGFLNGEDAGSMSSILAEHLPRLIETSRLFCSKLEEDPSAWGVSRAFVEVQGDLEATFVQWSSVVGEVISPTQRSESQATSEDGHTSGTNSASSSWYRRRSATASSALQPGFQLNLSMTPVNACGSKNKKSARGTKGKKITEQDVVIAPTQRAIRYVLMYRELLLHTPATSASRTHVTDALQCATRIARLCDEAQKHAVLSPTSA